MKNFREPFIFHKRWNVVINYCVVNKPYCHLGSTTLKSWVAELWSHILNKQQCTSECSFALCEDANPIFSSNFYSTNVLKKNLSIVNNGVYEGPSFEKAFL